MRKDFLFKLVRWADVVFEDRIFVCRLNLLLRPVKWQRAEVFCLVEVDLNPHLFRLLVFKRDAILRLKDFARIEVFGQFEPLLRYLNVVETVETIDAHSAESNAISQKVPPLVKDFQCVWP